MTKGLQRSARSWLMTDAGPMPIEWTGPKPSGVPCSRSSTATNAATAPAEGAEDGGHIGGFVARGPYTGALVS